MGHYASEMRGEPFLSDQTLTGDHVEAVARNFLLLSPQIRLQDPSDACQIYVHKRWRTSDPAQTWVTIEFNKQSANPSSPDQASAQRYTHPVSWKVWEVGSRLWHAWSALTSRNPQLFSEYNRAFGQCAVSALVAHDIMGGDIVNCVASRPDGSRESHYANLIDGQVIDFTRIQFPAGTIFSEFAPKPGNFSNTRDRLLSDSDTERRYKILVENYDKAKPA